MRLCLLYLLSSFLPFLLLAIFAPRPRQRCGTWKSHQMKKANHVNPKMGNGEAEDAVAPPSSPEPSVVSITPPLPPPPCELDIGPKVMVGLYVIICVCLTVSMGAPWFLMEQHAAGPMGEDVKEAFQLWKTTRWVGSERKSIESKFIICTPARRRVVALQVISVVALGMALFTLFISVVRDHFMRESSKVRLMLIYCVAICFIVLTAESSLGINIFTHSFDACGAQSSYHARAFEVYAGFACTVTAWALNALAGVVVYNKVLFPMDGRVIEYGMNAFAMLTFAAFLFSLMGCPITQWFYKDTDRRTLTETMLWKERYSVLWEIRPRYNTTEVRKLECRSLMYGFLAAEVLSCLTILLNAATFVMGFFLAKGLFGFTGYAVVLGCTATVVALIQWVLLVAIYSGEWCFGAVAYRRKKYVLAAGFALSVAGCFVMCFATLLLVLTEYIRRKQFPSLGPNKTIREILVEMCQ
ncbi:hypothetical protein TRSC58_03740 [Trypanosoma rangeli SC58]|uniref:Amastin n=1 Tax=Trypanosoma rangeli SC58 TaxID=429131 RepID=A0A061J2N5_TRYRA|nr:hypothetical protein TRSC58_03740 [Trypanosoma rangeli SC58]